MPKRVIDFDAMWGSDKLAACAEWAQAEYAWLYGLADASGCFELTNLRVIWGRVAAIRRNLSLERLEQIFHEFQDKGLLFVWEENGKRYGHWTGSDVPGRLPAPSWRIRLERLAPPVPKAQLAEFVSRFSRGRAASPGGGFFGETLRSVEQRSLNHPVEVLNGSLELPHAQDWKWDQKQDREGIGKSKPQPSLPDLNSKSEIQWPEVASAPSGPAEGNYAARAAAAGSFNAGPGGFSRFNGSSFRETEKALAVSRELMVGRGPECGPVRVKPEALERIRAREKARSP
jgi:hypothetical protein